MVGRSRRSRAGEDVDVTVRENRRLQNEVRQLRARVAALESSRWWHLHPRIALRRLRSHLFSAGRGADRPEPPPEAPPASRVADPLIARFREDVFARGNFSRDRFTRNIQLWEPILGELEGRARILELGSFEGLSACFLLWRLPDARITCVDNFIGAPEYAAYGEAVPEATFDQNVSLVDAARVRKLVGDTGRVLVDLVEERAQFDLVYVDASHRALDVMVDASLSWNLLVPGGIVIFDDYDWVSLGDDPLLRPAPAIDAFLGLVSGHAKVLVKHERQVIARKTGEPVVGAVAIDGTL